MFMRMFSCRISIWICSWRGRISRWRRWRRRFWRVLSFFTFVLLWIFPLSQSLPFQAIIIQHFYHLWHGNKVFWNFLLFWEIPSSDAMFSLWDVLFLDPISGSPYTISLSPWLNFSLVTILTQDNQMPTCSDTTWSKNDLLKTLVKFMHELF